VETFFAARRRPSQGHARTGGELQGRDSADRRGGFSAGEVGIGLRDNMALQVTSRLPAASLSKIEKWSPKMDAFKLWLLKNIESMGDETMER